jgi:NAD(P)-dependent dehydrogenase (short-subunit alcohol dehydrogenase family)
MARILITGSSDGLGSLTAKALVQRGHSVVLHARSDKRAQDAKSACPGAETCVVADLSDISQTKKLAEDINRLGAFDAVIHNAGLYTGPYRKTKEGWPSIFAVNTLSPYILTCLQSPRPKRLVYVSSGLHSGGDPSLKDITWRDRGEKGFRDFSAYSDTKLHDILLANFFARKYPEVKSNSLDPGWVATKMGGASASGDINAAVDTYVMLAEGSEEAKDATGKYCKYSTFAALS